MDQAKLKIALRYGLIGLIILAAVIGTALNVAPHKKLALPELAQYLPASTVFALRADRESVMGISHHSISDADSLRGWQNSSRAYWQTVERITGLPMSTIMIVVTEDKGVLWQSVFFTTESAIKDEDVTRLAATPFDEAAWYPLSTDTLHFQRIDAHIGAILSTHDTLDYTSPSAEAAQLLTSDPIALYVKHDIGQQIADMVAADTLLPGINQLIHEEDSLQFGLSVNDPMVQIHWSNKNPGSAQAMPLRVPEQVTAAFSGDLQRIIDPTTPETHPFSAAVQAFVNQQANANSFDPKIFEKKLFAVKGMIILGDNWLLTGDDGLQVAELVSYFIGAQAPKRAITALPDGTPYREIVRGLPVPQIEEREAYKASVWSETTTTSTSTPAVSEPRKLYTSENNGTWYISNSPELLDMQFSDKQGLLFADTKTITACMSKNDGDTLQDEELWTVSLPPDQGSDAKGITISSISRKSEQNREFHDLCIE